MLAKYWKKICVIILVIACGINIYFKLSNRISLNKELLSSAKYMYEEFKYQSEKNVIE